MVITKRSQYLRQLFYVTRLLCRVSAGVVSEQLIECFAAFLDLPVAGFVAHYVHMRLGIRAVDERDTAFPQMPLEFLIEVGPLFLNELEFYDSEIVAETKR